MAKLIANVDDLDRNIAQLEQVRSAPFSNDREPFVDLIFRGRNLYAYEHDGEVHFAPSRFLGYLNNSISKHRRRTDKDGRETTTVIRQILHVAPQENATLERLFQLYCSKLAPGAAVHRNKRTYWFKPETLSFARSRKGLGKVHREVLTEVSEDELAEIEKIARNKKIKATERKALIDARIGQGPFRSSLLRYWESECSASGCGVTAVLRASHIKPWSVCDNLERLDTFNGLLLTANLDALFDKGLITFDDAGTMLVSEEIESIDEKLLVLDERNNIVLDPRHLPYLAYHRAEVFGKRRKASRDLTAA